MINSQTWKNYKTLKCIYNIEQKIPRKLGLKPVYKFDLFDIYPLN